MILFRSASNALRARYAYYSRFDHHMIFAICHFGVSSVATVSTVLFFIVMPPNSDVIFCVDSITLFLICLLYTMTEFLYSIKLFKYDDNTALNNGSFCCLLFRQHCVFCCLCKLPRVCRYFILH